MSDEHAAGRRLSGEGLGDDSKSEPAPDPFYMSPPTGARLRWSIAWHVVAPLALAALFIASGMAQGHTLGVVIGLVVLAVLTPLQWIRLRPIVRELRSRRQGNAPAAPGSSWIPKGNAALWYVGTLTAVVAGGTLLALILGLANWSDGSNATFAMGLLGIVPSGFCIWVLMTLLKRSGSRRSLGSE